MTTSASEPSDSLEALIQLRDYAIQRVTELHVDMQAISETGYLIDCGLSMLEQIKMCKVGIYCWTNELRLYDRLIKDFPEK